MVHYDRYVNIHPMQWVDYNDTNLAANDVLSQQGDEFVLVAGLKSYLAVERMMKKRVIDSTSRCFR
jgi:hypothetical protein